jgi:hypothetical protein
VEAGVGEPELVGGLAVAIGTTLGDRRLELCDGLVGRVRGSQPGERDLELDAGLDELHQRDALRLEHRRDGLAQVATDPLVLRAGHEDAAAGSARGPDEVRARKEAQCLAQCRPADAELAGELVLRAEPVVRPQVVLHDVAADLEGDLLATRTTRLAEPRRTWRVCGHSLS